MNLFSDDKALRRSWYMKILQEHLITVNYDIALNM